MKSWHPTESATGADIFSSDASQIEWATSCNYQGSVRPGAPIFVWSNDLELAVFTSVVHLGLAAVVRDGSEMFGLSDVHRDTSTSRHSDVQAIVQFIHQESGLTWDELARLFGVSKRAMLQWSAGAKLSARNDELARSFAAIVESARRASPEETRHALLSREDGQSLASAWVSEHKQAPGVNAPSLPPEELMG